MVKLDLEKEPEIKLPAFIGSSKKAKEFHKTSTSASLTTLKLLTVWITTNWKILKEMEITDHLTYLLKNLYAGQEATVKTTWNKSLVPNQERSTLRLYIVTQLI